MKVRRRRSLSFSSWIYVERNDGRAEVHSAQRIPVQQCKDVDRQHPDHQDKRWRNEPQFAMFVRNEDGEECRRRDE